MTEVHVPGRLLFDRAGWTGGAPDAGSALVVDSWLVDAGRVRGLQRHLARFAASCRALARITADEQLSAFLRAAPAALPVSGRWFPRVELHASPPRYVLWIRPAPEPAEEIGLWVPDGPDPRRLPAHKGPDLAVLAGLRERARALGYDDAVLLDPDGSAREAAHSALIWWRDERLMFPSGREQWLPSVTAGLIADLAAATGQQVGTERCSPEQLAGAEIWAVNALHGIRPVRRWGPRVGRPVDADRLARWRALLDSE